MKTISIRVSGKVQGVFFRQSTREKAATIGIKGTVENRPGGDVLIIATGTTAQLDELVSWCRVGPPKAKVEGVQVEETSTKDFDSFSIIRY